MDHHRGVVEPVAEAQRRSDDQDGQQIARSLEEPPDRRFDRVEERILQQQIVDRIAGQAEFGKGGDADAARVAEFRHRDDRRCVGIRVGQGGRNGAGGDADEAMRIDRTEAHGRADSRKDRPRV